MSQSPWQPLATRMRPNNLTEFVGQEHILGKDKPLFNAISSGQPHSMVLWGPPGVGKTTLAKVIADTCDAHFEATSAVLAGVKDIRTAVDRAQQAKTINNQKTILFVDEVHRFNKAQQDAFLPYIEDGTLIFIGATTENPSFELNNALLSRARVYKLRQLSHEAMLIMMNRALIDNEKGLGQFNLKFSADIKDKIIAAADGDGRRILNLLEIAADLAKISDGQTVIDDETLNEILQQPAHRFDKQGDIFYEQISALHKAVRGSSPDASLYWFIRMIDGGCDPLYIARRVVRMASEDIGNADPRGLSIALDAWNTYERLGSPEGELAIAQAIAYLACAPKSNAVYAAFQQVKKDVQILPSYEVPMHIRNAPTQLMKDFDYGKEYRYAHDEAYSYSAGENYFPKELKDKQYYFPVNRGLELKINEKLAKLRDLDQASQHKRYVDK